MPRFLFCVDELSRERTSLTHAYLSLGDEEWAGVLAHRARMHDLKERHGEVAELKLYIEARWFRAGSRR